jgi:arginine decarboxylase-like protein
VIKAREVRERLKGKLDPEILHVLEALAEADSIHQLEMHSLAQLIDQITDIVMAMGAVNEAVKNAVDAANLGGKGAKLIKAHEDTEDGSSR